MGRQRQQMSRENTLRYKAMYPHGYFHKKADNGQNLLTSMALTDGGGAVLQALPWSVTLTAANQLFTCPHTVTVGLSDASGTGLSVTLEFDYIDGDGVYRTTQETFTVTVTSLQYFQTTLTCIYLAAVRIVRVSGQAVSDQMRMGHIANTTSGNGFWGFQLPRHIKSSSDFQIWSGITSRTLVTPAQATDFNRGIFYPPQTGSETAYFLICKPPVP